MRALLVVAHGSRRSSSNEEVAALVEQVRQRMKLQDAATARFDSVSCAFLELAEPSIPAALQMCVAAGADEVVVLPYFLSAGRHVSQDIPEIIANARASLSPSKITIAPYLGMAEEMPGLVLDLAKI